MRTPGTGLECRLACTAMKWIGPIGIAVVGILVGIVAIMYLTTPIHSLPAFIGGKSILGHYRRRGEGLALIAVAALGGAAYWAFRIQHAGDQPGGGGMKSSAATTATTDTLLGTAPSEPESPAAR
jgi:hypothetical protein